MRWFCLLIALAACGDGAPAGPDATVDAPADACAPTPPADDLQLCGSPPCSCRVYVIEGCDPTMGLICNTSGYQCCACANGTWHQLSECTPPPPDATAD